MNKQTILKSQKKRGVRGWGQRTLTQLSLLNAGCTGLPRLGGGGMAALRGPNAGPRVSSLREKAGFTPHILLDDRSQRVSGAEEKSRISLILELRRLLL